MIIKYCSNCPGNPYTENLDLVTCPVCDSILSTKMIPDRSFLQDWAKLPVDSGAFDVDSMYGGDNCGAFDDIMYGNAENTDDDSSGVDVEVQQESSINYTSKSGSKEGICIRGKVSQYKVSDRTSGYRRLLPRKIKQAIQYGQRFEDVLHSFAVTEKSDRDAMGCCETNTYIVNIHGSTNYGASIVDNEEVEVFGQFTNDNIFMAREVKVINGTMATPVKFQRSVKLISACIIFAVCLLLGLIAALGADGGVMANIGDFIVTMFVVYVILLILYLVASFSRFGIIARLSSSRKQNKSPLVAMLIVSFIVTLILYNVFGVGAAIGNMLFGALGMVGPIIIVIVAIVLLLKAIIK